MNKQSNVLVHLRCCAAFFCAALALAGCTVRGVHEAPIEDKSSAMRPRPTAPITTAPAPREVYREASNGIYVVQSGDTLYSIAVAFGQDYRDIARWNNLLDPTKISVGQSLRVVPPEGGDTGSAAVVGVVNVNPSGATETRTLEAVPGPTPAAPPPIAAAPPTVPAPSAPAPSPSNTAPSPAAPPTAPPNTAPSANAPVPAPAPVEPIAKAQPPGTPPPAASSVLWQWPAKGKVIDGFNETRNKGIDIGGSEGEAVFAASDGEVVYSGSGLRMYGNLVIIKHNDDYISAYAHNKQILVKQGQSVKRGQRIADLGKTDDGQAKLHFEIRYRGKPVDPMKHLPPR
jgi:lipoprotein NlpD